MGRGVGPAAVAAAACVAACVLFGLNALLLGRAAPCPSLPPLRRLPGGPGLSPDRPCLRPAPGPRPRLPVRLARGAEAKIALVVLCFNRRRYLERTMASLLQRLPAENFPVIVSQDGDEAGMADFVRKTYVEPGLAVHVQHRRRKEHKGSLKSYYYIADHFKFAFGQVFDVLKFDTAVIVEDDMLVAPDFFDYMHAMAPRLHADRTLLCVSAWNDNGLEGVLQPTDAASEVRRTSVFPGLGWMLTRRLWEELKPKWPKAFWDDWLREANQTRGRDCLYPAVSRTRTIGKIGSSSGQFFERYLARIVLNKEVVAWEKMDLSSLDLDVYEKRLFEQVAAAKTVVRGKPLDEALEGDTDVRVFYDGKSDYRRLADQLKIMNDLKEGIPRSSFKGIVRLHTTGGANLFLVPSHMQGHKGISPSKVGDK